jgi:GNAT superfamily N-acetyltransferase
MQVEVTRLSAADVLGVRRTVLRDGRTDVPADFPEDEGPHAIHVGARRPAHAADGPAPPNDNPLIGVATLFPSPRPDDPDAWQLRGMAVLPEHQGQGIGGALLAAGARLVKEAGGSQVWAHARNTALGFYERQGWKVVGDTYEYGVMRLPHHLVMLELADA